MIQEVEICLDVNLFCFTKTANKFGFWSSWSCGIDLKSINVFHQLSSQGRRAVVSRRQRMQ